MESDSFEDENEGDDWEGDYGKIRHLAREQKLTKTIVNLLDSAFRLVSN